MGIGGLGFQFCLQHMNSLLGWLHILTVVFLRCLTVLTLMASWDFHGRAPCDGLSWLPHRESPPATHCLAPAAFWGFSACLHDPFTLSYFMPRHQGNVDGTGKSTAKSPFYSVRRGECHPHSESFLLNQISLETSDTLYR